MEYHCPCHPAIDVVVAHRSYLVRLPSQQRGIDMNRLRGPLVLLFALFVSACTTTERQAQENKSPGNMITVYVGTYTGPKSKGIYEMKFDLATGKLSKPEVAGEMKD